MDGCELLDADAGNPTAPLPEQRTHSLCWLPLCQFDTSLSSGSQCVV